MRQRLSQALDAALRDQDAVAVSTLRLILAAVRDRDSAARTRGGRDPIPDDGIRELLQTMIRQRRESVARCEAGGRPDLAAREQRESEIIAGFLPRQLDPGEVDAAVTAVIAELGASGLRDMGRVMGALRARYVGRMDFGRASAGVRNRLTAG